MLKIIEEISLSLCSAIYSKILFEASDMFTEDRYAFCSGPSRLGSMLARRLAIILAYVLKIEDPTEIGLQFEI